MFQEKIKSKWYWKSGANINTFLVACIRKKQPPPSSSNPNRLHLLLHLFYLSISQSLIISSQFSSRPFSIYTTPLLFFLIFLSIILFVCFFFNKIEFFPTKFGKPICVFSLSSVWVIICMFDCLALCNVFRFMRCVCVENEFYDVLGDLNISHQQHFRQVYNWCSAGRKLGCVRNGNENRMCSPLTKNISS